MTLLLLPLHGVGTRRDLPLPFEYVLAGAAVTLLITFALLGWARRRPRFTRALGLALPGLTRVVDHPVCSWGLRGLALAGYLWFGLALVAGKDSLTNPVFGWVFACLWVGLVPVSLLFATVWREAHPAWALGVLVDRLRGREGEGEVPKRVGAWPAAMALLVFAWLELVQPGRATLPVLGWYVLAYWGWVLGGVLLLGRGWVRSADPLCAYAELVARLSPWQRIDGVLHLVNPLRHLATHPVRKGTFGLVTVLLGSTAMDSWTGGSGWVRWLQDSGAAPVAAAAGALTLTTTVVALTLGPAIGWLRPRLAGPAALGELLDDVAATCAPIVVGYALAHYATLLVLEGQRTFIQASDPLGRGWDVFATAELGVNSFLLDISAAVASWQVLVIVGGHVLGVLAAHERGLVLLRPAEAVRGQLPLFVVMLVYTLAGLMLLFSA